MAKLFPPLIEGAIPAFYSENGMVKITIPFSINRAVSNAQVKGLALKIKTAQSSSYLFTNITTDIKQFNLEGAPWVEFRITEQELINKIRVGQFYKFQIAFIDNSNEIGYYSTVGVGKYTTKPTVIISNLSSGGVNIHYYRYEGRYSQKDKDITEKVYSYHFNIYDDEEKIITSSGELLHDSSQDTELDESYDVFNLTIDLEDNKNYYIQYTVTTINNLVISTPKYKITQQYSVDSQILAYVTPTLNYEEGYIQVSLTSRLNDMAEKENASGTFILSRSCEDDNYKLWNELCRFRLVEEIPDKDLWKDFTIEQGKHYKYSIQQYSDKGLLSSRIISQPVYADFEYAFLYDGERQLKIKFNPKVTSLKIDVLETKTNTIGSKYPFIFRNGQVYYKEFSISGLISHQMDEEELFIRKEDLYLSKDLLTKKGRSGTPDHIIEREELIEREKLTNLNSENITAERLFKLKVLEWLTNGETKLFRSPTEGNYIVRLMNVSMSPNDILGRMLHTFTCTAYEVAEFSYENLQSLKVIESEIIAPEYQYWETVNFADKVINEDGTVSWVYKEPGVMNDFIAHSVEFFDMRPGSLITLTFENGSQTNIRIGLSGRYSIKEGVSIRTIEIHGPTTGGMTYSYTTTIKSTFDTISNIYLEDIPARQFIGEHNIIQEIEYVYDSEHDKIVKNPKVDITNFFYVYSKPRNTEEILKARKFATTNYYYYKYYNDKNDYAFLSIVDPTKLYVVDDKEINRKYYYDFANKKQIELNNRNKELTINDNIVEVNDVAIAAMREIDVPALGGIVDYYPMKFIEMNNVGKLQALQSSNGLITEVGYQIRIIDYSIEDDFRYNTFDKKVEYEEAILNLEKYLKNASKNYSAEQEQIYRDDIDKKYTTYILALAQDLADNSISG